MQVSTYLPICLTCIVYIHILEKYLLQKNIGRTYFTMCALHFQTSSKAIAYLLDLLNT